MKFLAIGLGALYVLSPIDFVPDVIPFFGWLDDIGVIALVVKYLNGAPKQIA